MRRSSALRVLASVLGLVLVLGGPVGAQEPPDAPPDLATAVEATVATGSIGVDMVLSIRGTSASGPMSVALRASGAAQLQGERRMRLTLDMVDYGGGGMEILFIDPLLFVRGEVWESEMDGAEWLGIDVTSGDPVVTDFRDLVTGQNDASLALYWLLGATGPVVPLKREEVRGIATQRYVLQLDLASALPLLPDEVRPLLEANITEFRTQGIDPTFAADAWVGDDGLVHRVHYEFLDLLPGVTEMNVTYDFSGFGEPVDVERPDGSVVRWLTEEPASST
ncbi:MAG: hypothetical protein KF809_08465 [Chloroflexi bacterium]|nr:hypothetical protein [Chloroflexota bacterium]